MLKHRRDGIVVDYSVIKQQIDDYCRFNLLDQPSTWSAYIDYAKRFRRVALITSEEYEHFVMYVDDQNK